MEPNKKNSPMQERKVILSILWIFVMFNYLYCDVLTNMGSEVLKGYLAGQVGSLQITQGFLLGAAILMEIPTAMLLLSWVLPSRANRIANILAGTLMTAVQAASLFVGTGPTLHYLFYSVIEIACTAFIAGYAWQWKSALAPEMR